MIKNEILDNIYTGICIIKPDYTIYAWNRFMTNLTGLTIDEFKDKKLFDVCSAFKEETIQIRLQMVLDSKIPIVFSAQLHKTLYKNNKSNDTERYLETTASAINISENQQAIILTVKDITELTNQVIKYRDIKDQAIELANKDTLTGLYNRRFMNNKITEEINRNDRFSRIFSIVIADIDFFKKINDTYGHNAGDLVLQTVRIFP